MSEQDRIEQMERANTLRNLERIALVTRDRQRRRRLRDRDWWLAIALMLACVGILVAAVVVEIWKGHSP